MSVINIPLGLNYENTLRDYIIKTFKEKAPNFGTIKIITPSRKTAQILQKSFAEKKVIMPKVSSITEISDRMNLNPISSFKEQILIFDIIKQHLPSLSENDIFAFISSF